MSSDLKTNCEWDRVSDTASHADWATDSDGASLAGSWVDAVEAAYATTPENEVGKFFANPAQPDVSC